MLVLASMFLLGVHPLVPIGLIGVIGGGIYAAYRFLWKTDDAMPPDDGDAITNGDANGTPTPSPTPDQKTANLVCKKTGQKYDVNRWASPAHVAAGIVALGYPVGPTLVTPSDVEQIKKLQRRFAEDGIGPYANAPNSWIHGRAGPCFLISLSAAEAKLKAGQWKLGGG